MWCNTSTPKFGNLYFPKWRTWFSKIGNNSIPAIDSEKNDGVPSSFPCFSWTSNLFEPISSNFQIGRENNGKFGSSFLGNLFCWSCSNYVRVVKIWQVCRVRTAFSWQVASDTGSFPATFLPAPRELWQPGCQTISRGVTPILWEEERQDLWERVGRGRTHGSPERIAADTEGADGTSRVEPSRKATVLPLAQTFSSGMLFHLSLPFTKIAHEAHGQKTDMSKVPMVCGVPDVW